MPIDKSLQQSIDSVYKEGNWSAIKNAIRREFGRDMDREQQAQFTKKFSELLVEDRLSIVRILERRGYYALDRNKWID
jgi:bisphosphoglycerate-independent phosphoglycerate mutase (AlkP superfamily)